MILVGPIFSQIQVRKCKVCLWKTWSCQTRGDPPEKCSLAGSFGVTLSDPGTRPSKSNRLSQGRTRKQIRRIGWTHRIRDVLRRNASVLRSLGSRNEARVLSWRFHFGRRQSKGNHQVLDWLSLRQSQIQCHMWRRLSWQQNGQALCLCLFVC